MDNEHLSQLYEALESARGGVLVCETALRCFINEDLKQELNEYLKHVRHREQTLREILADLHLETQRTTTVCESEQSLINAMERALVKGDPVTAQLVAVECVVEAVRRQHGSPADRARRAPVSLSEVAHYRSCRLLSRARGQSPVRCPTRVEPPVAEGTPHSIQ